MSDGAVSHSVTKLKELLFDTEAQHLAELSRRLDQIGSQLQDTRSAIAERRAYEEGARAELSRRIDTVFDRAGSTERFSQSVSDVLDQAIVRAETQRHDSLESALAPVMIKSVKREILNSQDTLVEALYPMTGQMVKAYVASAMKDLVNEVNRRLESNALMLRIKSLTTGRSMAELALAESQRLEVQDLLLIRRGTGELVSRWPDRPGSDNDDHVLGGVLTAINSFATEALHTEENALRQIDLGESQVYLRSSPSYLLAAKCTGTAGASIEQVIDDEFLSTVSDLQGPGDREEPAHAAMATLGPRLGTRISEQFASYDTPALGVSPFKILATIILLPLLAWIAWSLWTNFEANRVRETAKTIIEASNDIKGYPMTLAVGPRGRTMAISGLAPSQPVLQAVMDRLSAALPKTTIHSHVAVVPQGARDATPEITALRQQLSQLGREVWRHSGLRSLERARLGLGQATASLSGLNASTKSATDEGDKATAAAGAALGQRLGTTSAVVTNTIGALADPGFDETAAASHAATLGQRGQEFEAAIAALERAVGLGSNADGTANAAAAKASPNLADAADRLADLAHRLQLLTVTVTQARLMRAAIPKPAAPTAFERLATFVATNAIFFGDDTAYRDQVVADTQLDSLAALIGEAGVLVRVIGYTDERGTVTRNTSLSQVRADKVRDDLVKRGVPAGRLVAVGRLSMIDISPTTGSTSPNRRVEFELGFKGEGGP